MPVKRGDAPPKRADEIEVDNDPPGCSLGLEGRGCVQELELWEEREREKIQYSTYMNRWLRRADIIMKDVSNMRPRVPQPPNMMEDLRLRVVLFPLSLWPKRRILTSG